MNSGLPTPEELDSRVVVYSRRYCGFCVLAHRLLKGMNIEFRDVDVTGNQGARRWLEEKSNQATLPQIFIDQRSIGGFTELQAVARRGELDELRRSTRT